ncbi:psbQ-like protein 3, chloroplastic isoform X2 [Sorghum bicolor]|uniref:psbQ-like protein 3, chloroplastic isoform X2 n=1 Tax=Sorghum bicolor TaxID=4558 RepID=UPI0001A86E50|nr:psbQ-like protein 3, chloroplastic isoform X2 [Sorghum bicolor]|eukprot:XP_002446803.1 psbQ-like protein 3, chloroplastic isoform X2 [Sorghum bicolor]
MALRLAVQALSATLLSRAETTSPSPKPPSKSNNSKQQSQRPAGAAAAATTTSGRRLATASVAAVLASQLLPPVASSGAGTFDLRLTLPEKSSEEAEAVVRTHARNLLGVKRFIDAGAWRELQAALRASASNLKQDLYAIIQAKPTGQRPELRRLYSDLFNSVTSLDYAARDKDQVQVQEHYGNIVSALDEIFAKIM